MTGKQITTAENTLLQIKDKIDVIIPSGFDKFRTFVASASLNNDGLNQASYNSIVQAFIDCAKSGLMPDGKEASIVTRFDRSQNLHVATFQPMVKGCARLINESENIKSFHVKVVYDGDEFDMWSDEAGDHLKFRPSFDIDRSDDNKIKLFYACAVLDNGTSIIEVMTKAQVEKHRKSAKQQHVWNAWFSEMGVKTIIHRILKRLPITLPEVVKGLESSLDIDLASGSEPKFSFKSKAEFNRTLTTFAECVAGNDKDTANEAASEMTKEQKRYLLHYLANNEFGGYDACVSGIEFGRINSFLLELGEDSKNEEDNAIQ